LFDRKSFIITLMTLCFASRKLNKKA